jgi:hypothetical protein
MSSRSRVFRLWNRTVAGRRGTSGSDIGRRDPYEVDPRRRVDNEASGSGRHALRSWVGLDPRSRRVRGNKMSTGGHGQAQQERTKQPKSSRSAARRNRPKRLAPSLGAGGRRFESGRPDSKALQNGPFCRLLSRQRVPGPVECQQETPRPAPKASVHLVRLIRRRSVHHPKHWQPASAHESLASAATSWNLAVPIQGEPVGRAVLVGFHRP